MEKEFIPYEQALALKELGFSSSYPIGGYQGGAVFYYEKGNLYYDGRPIYSSDAHAGQIDAPLYQQAFRWFREKCGLNSHIHQEDRDEYSYCCGQGYSDEIGGYLGFGTYEEAELECLKELIEIVKRK